jgi:glycosyltransferase involved in cell wall biosynthesis
MTTVPRLSIGLPVYNGDEYLAESLDALLGQSYADFELIITDNASTDGTEEICRKYVAADPRVRYERLAENIGAANNHNHVFTLARGELFKWASHDDLYGRDLLARCVEALDERPEMVLAHSWNATIDSAGKIIEPFDYRLATDSPSAPERFRALLFAPGGDDFYGVIRTEVLRRVKPHASYHHADRTFVIDLVMQGPFYQTPELLYFRRDHPTRAERAHPSVRSRCANLDPRRANRFRNPNVRLLAEYVLGYVGIIRRAPITAAEKRQCFRYLAQYLTNRARAGVGATNEAMGIAPEVQLLSIDGIVPGHEADNVTDSEKDNEVNTP